MSTRTKFELGEVQMLSQEGIDRWLSQLDTCLDSLQQKLLAAMSARNREAVAKIRKELVHLQWVSREGVVECQARLDVHAGRQATH